VLVRGDVQRSVDAAQSGGDAAGIAQVAAHALNSIG
jgi:hypothetical protein